MNRGYKKHRKLFRTIPLDEWLAWRARDGSSLFEYALHKNDVFVVRACLSSCKTTRFVFDYLYYFYMSEDMLAILLSQGYMRKLPRHNYFDFNSRILPFYIMNGVKFTYSSIPETDVQTKRMIPVWKTIKRYERCKKNILILLALKRRRIRCMRQLDRFLIRELTFTIYASRYEYKAPETLIPDEMCMYFDVYGKFISILVCCGIFFGFVYTCYSFYQTTLS